MLRTCRFYFLAYWVIQGSSHTFNQKLHVHHFYLGWSIAVWAEFNHVSSLRSMTPLMQRARTGPAAAALGLHGHHWFKCNCHPQIA